MTQSQAARPRTTAGGPRRTRETTLAGLCYLVVIVGGLFAQGMVRQALIVPGDASATALAISENPTLWRLGIAVHLLYLVPALTMKFLVCGCYVVNTIAMIVTPDFSALIFPAIMAPVSRSRPTDRRHGPTRTAFSPMIPTCNSRPSFVATA